MTRFLRNKRAITPVLSSLLLTVITVAAMSLAATAAYVISDNLHQTMGERFIVEDVWFRTGSINIYLRNIGKVDLTISSVYVNFTLQSTLPSTSPFALQVGKHGWLNVTYTWASGKVYNINIITTRGTKVADYYVAP
jgi:FlaG/FlaF family flagellin (archaellin)